MKYLLFLLLGFLISCKTPKNDEIMPEIEQDFQDSIKLNNAQYFEYQFDGLTPQKSYFVGNKLRFLNLRIGGEDNINHKKFIFDEKTDKLIIQIDRMILRDNFDEPYDKDSVFISDYRTGEQQVFVGNKLIKTRSIKEESLEWFYSVKKYTETEYQKK